MGISASKKKRKPFRENKDSSKVLLLAERVKLMQKEVREMVCNREKETRAYEREMFIYAGKEAEWKKERRVLREEVKRLNKVVEEKEERIREIEVGNLLIEHMEEEKKARRDEAVDKWKQLYLTIKTELDELIERTYQGEMLNSRGEEGDLMDEMRRELQAKEDTIEVLQAQLTSAKQEESKKCREADILRQSLRIIGGKKSKKYC